MLKRGVTLTELLITIIIISILSVIIATSFTTGTEAAEKAQLQQMANEATNALVLALAQRPFRPWPAMNPTDRTHWVPYLRPGDSAKLFTQKANFGFYAPNNTTLWPNKWGDNDYYYSHHGEIAGTSIPIGELPPKGCPVPEKIYVWDEISASTIPDIEPMPGLPYKAFP